MSERQSRAFLFHACAAGATTAVMVAGGGLTALIAVGGAPGSQALVLVLKAFGVAAYLVAIALSVCTCGVKDTGASSRSRY